MSAVTRDGSIASETRSRTLCPLNQQLTPIASSRPGVTDVLSTTASSTRGDTRSSRRPTVPSLSYDEEISVTNFNHEPA
jgi:hypothetical protein